MRIQNIQTTAPVFYTPVKKEKTTTSPAMTGIIPMHIKPKFFQKLKAFINSKLSLKKQSYVKEVKANIANIMQVTRPIEASTQKKALKMFLLI